MDTALFFAADAPVQAIEAATAEPVVASLTRAGAPLLVARAPVGAVIAMNEAARDLFGPDLDAVSARLFHGREPGAQRLATLARTLLPGAAPRLERLRFFFGPSVETLSVFCRRVQSEDGEDLLVLAAPGVRAGLLSHPPLPPRAEPDEEPRPNRDRAPAAASRRRLVWRTDKDGRLLDPSPELLAALRIGAEQVGRHGLPDLFAADPDERRVLRDALARRETFAGLMAGALEWGGMPQRGEHGAFAGFRGFVLAQRALAEQAPESVASPTIDQESPTRSDVAPPNNVVLLRPVSVTADGESASPTPALSASERSAFDEIARALSGSWLGVVPPPSDDALNEASALASETHDTVAIAPVADDDLRRVLDLAPIGICVSRGGVPLFANRTLLDLLGHTDLAEFATAGGLDRALEGADAGDGAEPPRITAADGEIVPVDVRLQTTLWDGAAATLVSLRCAKDRAALARMTAVERALRDRESEVRDLAAILDTATDGVVVLDPQGHVVSLNKSAEALLGCDGADFVGRPLEVMVADESRAAVAEYFASLRDRGVASVLNDGREILCRAPRSGGTIPVFITMGRLGPEDAPRTCAVLRDLTAWKRAEQAWSDARREAERTSSLKSDFLARVSHEIRTPLNAILGFAEVIMDERFGPVGNERYREYLKDIHRSGEHVMSLVNDLLDISKIEAGKMDMTFTAVDANATVSECVSLLQPQASRARVVMRLSLAPRLPKVVADERAFKQIVLNILSNAVKYNEAGGQVIVSTARTDAGHAVIRVRDTGPGMSESDVQTALEPFRQLGTARSTTVGTGLGLPLTKALVEANRAHFTIKSRRGEGTLVEVAFPASRVMAD